MFHTRWDIEVVPSRWSFQYQSNGTESFIRNKGDGEDEENLDIAANNYLIEQWKYFGEYEGVNQLM